MPPYVLDTSAVLCVLNQEDGADQVLALLGSSRSAPPGRAQVLVPFIALMELEYLLRRRLDSGEAERVLLLVESWPVEVRESNREWGYAAAQLKATLRVSMADAWIASLALLEDGELVHKDPELGQIPGLKTVPLPLRASHHGA
ncbi:MAG: PIN domain-containing protein [Chloroflexi bacterium]|nr:PIN domain-containing protein [Chloroflexota bacterium]